MESRQVQVSGETYKVSRHHEIKGLFYVLHPSGTHELARREDGTWHYISHSVLSKGFDLDSMGAAIDKLFDL
ncbi:hypothetical protein [Pedobacter faecalis]|uniref:hypothetical protein n=1 Tax=Pedobacter faecalis TaxID=3041495 RepID=UPI00254F6DFF|nr:hypothetical protein [Pedobacter sp. ELA7]